MHAFWVDSDPRIARSASVFLDAGMEVHFFGETADALKKFEELSGDETNFKVSLVVTSMMRRGGRQERGLMDGLHMLDEMRRRLKAMDVSIRPLFAMISASADEQECKDHSVDHLVLYDRAKFQHEVLEILTKKSDRSWRTEWKLRHKPVDCKNLFEAGIALKKELESEGPDGLFESGTDLCFCEKCEPKKVWMRGGHKYVLPTGWFRVGLTPRHEYLGRRNEIETWPVAYHGSGRDCLLSICKHHRVMFPGDTFDDGTKLKMKLNNCHADKLAGAGPVIYVSPSIIYASAPPYAIPFDLGGRKAQAVFQVRVNPSAINKFRETLRNRYTDPEFDSGELEWVIQDREAVVPYGLLVRYCDP